MVKLVVLNKEVCISRRIKARALIITAVMLAALSIGTYAVSAETKKDYLNSKLNTEQQARDKAEADRKASEEAKRKAEDENNQLKQKTGDQEIQLQQKDQEIERLNQLIAAKKAAQIKTAVYTAPAGKSSFSYQGGVLSAAQIQFLGNCESGMNPTTNTGNGFYGAYQFTIPTWNAMGTGYARADYAPLDVQTAAVQKLLSSSSIWTQFPGCAAKMSAAGLL